MIPANIYSSFKKCVVHPFNPEAIDCGVRSDSFPNSHSEACETTELQAATLVLAPTYVINDV